MLALAAFLFLYLVLETTHLYTPKLSTFQFPFTTPPRTQKGKREKINPLQWIELIPIKNTLKRSVCLQASGHSLSKIRRQGRPELEAADNVHLRGC